MRLNGQGRVNCEHCLKTVGVTRTRTTMGNPFVRKHPIGKRGSMTCQGSGVPVKMTPDPREKPRRGAALRNRIFADVQDKRSRRVA